MTTDTREILAAMSDRSTLPVGARVDVALFHRDRFLYWRSALVLRTAEEIMLGAGYTRQEGTAR